MILFETQEGGLSIRLNWTWGKAESVSSTHQRKLLLIMTKMQKEMLGNSDHPIFCKVLAS